MPGYDGAADREPKAHALRLGGHERFEKVCARLRRQADAVVDDGHGDAAIAAQAAPHDKSVLRPALRRHGIAGIADQIDQHLLNLNAIHEDVKLTRAMTKAVQAELDDLASWLGLDAVAAG